MGAGSVTPAFIAEVASGLALVAFLIFAIAAIALNEWERRERRK